MKFAVFGYTTPNLGDDVQGLAAGLILPSVDAYVDRDRLDKVALTEPHRLIMNSWFAVDRYSAVPSKDIVPIYFGMCVGRPELLNAHWIKEWSKNTPVGCRDEHSVTQLQSCGIQAHYTGCITAYMGRFISKPTKRSGIVFVDVPESMERFIPIDLRRNAIRITNQFNPMTMSQKSRFKSAAKVLDLLRTAELVVTRRLHAALPCIGFETPVMVYLSNDNKNVQRFSGPHRYVPIVFHDGTTPVDEASWLPPTVVRLPPTVEEHYNLLLSQLAVREAPRFDSVAAFVDTLPDIRLAPRSWVPYRTLNSLTSHFKSRSSRQ